MDIFFFSWQTVYLQLRQCCSVAFSLSHCKLAPTVAANDCNSDKRKTTHRCTYFRIHVDLTHFVP